MAHMACTVCNCIVEIPEFDLQKTYSTHSQSLLLILLQECIKEEFEATNYLICKMCYLLLDELDSIKVRAKSIENRFKSYLRTHCTSNKNYVDDNKSEECTVCCKKFECKNFKNHIKVHHPVLSDLEPSFGFDELNPIPALQEINLLDTVQSQNGVKPEEDVKVSEPRTKQKCSDNNVKPYKCSECSKMWKTAAELKNHMSAHSKERPYICEICGQAYKRQQALTVHVGMHNGINPFTCVYCNKSFTQKGALVRHTPIHTGELPFQCDLCGKRFVHHTSFNMHKLSHTGQKSFKCEVCGLLLMSGSHLKRHMRVHTGEKKFSCSTCGKKFAEKYNLVVHEKLHLGVSKKKKYQCQICNNLYNVQVKLEEHLLNVHHKVQYSPQSGS